MHTSFRVGSSGSKTTRVAHHVGFTHPDGTVTVWLELHDGGSRTTMEINATPETHEAILECYRQAVQEPLNRQTAKELTARQKPS